MIKKEQIEFARNALENLRENRYHPTALDDLGVFVYLMESICNAMYDIDEYIEEFGDELLSDEDIEEIEREITNYIDFYGNITETQKRDIVEEYIDSID